MKTDSFDTKTDNPAELLEWLGIPLRREGERSYRTAAFWRNDAHASVSLFFGTRGVWLYTDNSIGRSGDVFTFLKQLGLTTDDVRESLSAFESGAPVPESVAEKIAETCGYEISWPAHRSGANSIGQGVRDVRRIEPTRRLLDEMETYRRITALPPWLWAYNIEYCSGRTHDFWGVNRGGSYDDVELFDAALHADGGVKMSLGKKRPVILGEGKKIAVVEGSWDACAAHAMGYTRIMCLFGTGMAEQAANVLSLTRGVSEIVLMLDNDTAGKESEQKIIARLAAPHSLSPYEDGYNPGTCKVSTMQDALERVGLKDISNLWSALQGAQWGQSIGLEPEQIVLPEIPERTPFLLRK